MDNNLYDVVIIGGGVIGTSIARFLTRYVAKIAVIEKNNDVGEETTSANSAIVHSGYDPKPGTRKAYFNVLGNKMFDKVSSELDFEFKRIGSLTIAFNEEDVITLENLKKRADENNVETRIIEKDELKKLEPNISDLAIKALYAPSAGIVSPFNMSINLMENAMDNGAKLFLNNKVIKINKKHNFYEVFTDTGLVFKGKTLINAAGVYSDNICALLEKPEFSITPRKGEYYVLDHFDNNFIHHTLFMCPTKVGKGVLVSPTTSFNYIIGPSNDESSKDDKSTDKNTLNNVLELGKKLVPSLNLVNNIRQFSGIRANPNTDDFIIEESKINPGFYNVAGIMSPGLASSLAIGEYVSDLVAKNMHLDKNLEYNPTIKKHYSIKKESFDEYAKIVKDNPLYGHFICRCEKVSEGEIVDAIHRNCGATTIKGIKRRLRPGFGKCQGTFCEEETLKILARELKKDISEIEYSGKGTNILVASYKGKKYE